MNGEELDEHLLRIKIEITAILLPLTPEDKLKIWKEIENLCRENITFFAYDIKEFI